MLDQKAFSLLDLLLGLAIFSVANLSLLDLQIYISNKTISVKRKLSASKQSLEWSLDDINQANCLKSLLFNHQVIEVCTLRTNKDSKTISFLVDEK